MDQELSIVERLLAAATLRFEQMGGKNYLEYEAEISVALRRMICAYAQNPEAEHSFLVSRELRYSHVRLQLTLLPSTALRATREYALKERVQRLEEENATLRRVFEQRGS